MEIYKKLALEKPNGDVIGSINFNIGDREAMQKIFDLADNIGGLTDMLRNCRLHPDGTADGVIDAAVLEVVEQDFKKQFEAAFGAGSYNEFFTERKPFATLKGSVLYCQKVIEGLMQLIDAQLRNLIPQNHEGR